MSNTIMQESQDLPIGACMLVVTVRAEKFLGTIRKMFLIVIILTPLSVLIRRQRKKMH